jgi:hypothetical protein
MEFMKFLYEFNKIEFHKKKYKATKFGKFVI